MPTTAASCIYNIVVIYVALWFLMSLNVIICFVIIVITNIPKGDFICKSYIDVKVTYQFWGQIKHSKGLPLNRDDKPHDFNLNLVT